MMNFGNMAAASNNSSESFNYVTLDKDGYVCGTSSLSGVVDVPNMIRVTDSSDLMGKKYDHDTKTFIDDGKRKSKEVLNSFSETMGENGITVKPFETKEDIDQMKKDLEKNNKLLEEVLWILTKQGGN